LNIPAACSEEGAVEHTFLSGHTFEFSTVVLKHIVDRVLHTPGKTSANIQLKSACTCFDEIVLEDAYPFGLVNLHQQKQSPSTPKARI
jgi:hypothetical protein